jgi:hypothetical protein
MTLNESDTIREADSKLVLRAVSVSGKRFERVLRPGDSMGIGRGKGEDIVLEDRFVSRKHLSVRVSNAAVLVVDLSSNGTYLGETNFRRRHPSGWVGANCCGWVGRPLRFAPSAWRCLLLVGDRSP